MKAKPFAVILVAVVSANSVGAQTAIRIEPAPEWRLSWLTRPYQARTVPPVNLANTSRLERLLRAGNLYLSSRDVVALVQNTRSYQASYGQTWGYGTSATLSYSSTHVRVNSQLFNLNPFTNGNLDFQITQNLLNGFGRAVNERNIRVQRNNLKVTDLN